MKNLKRVIVIAAALVSSLLTTSHRCEVAAASNEDQPLFLMVSFDGLRADYLMEADRYGLKIPTLRRLMQKGTSARRMITVFPSVTYPAHVSLITGEPPARHGVLENERFQPIVEHHADWHWFARDVNVPTLLNAFKCAGRHTASVDWPVSVGAPANWILPEWWDSDNFTGSFVPKSRGAATPGLIESAEKEFNFTLAMEHIDEDKIKIARHIVRHYKPDLMLLHLEELDKTQHSVGPGEPKVLKALEMLDGLLGELLEEYEKNGLGKRLVACIVADHGFERVEKTFKPNTVLRAAGLIDYDESAKCITSWRAKAWISGASAALMLADPDDSATLEKARTALAKYTGQPDSPIARFIEKDEIRHLGSNIQSAFMLDAGPGFMYSRSCSGEPIEKAPIHGMHGQMPDRPQLAAGFVIAGPGIPADQIIDKVSILDVAPTLAQLAGVSFGHPTGKPIPELSAHH